mgnify:CR=1 FL=1
MKTLALRGQIQRLDNRFVIFPATKADEFNLNIYCTESKGKYSSISFKSGSGSKSYAQVKTAWALITMLCIARLGRKPTENEKNQMYEELLDEFADKRVKHGLLNDEDYIENVTMSEMTVAQLARFIQSMIQLLHENTHNFMISADDIVELGELFSEWNNFLSCLDVDPTDVDENGEYLSLDEYRMTHTVSYASGRTENLEMAHIVSRGSDPAFENCCWNVMMLTHEEHQEIMHQEGWNSLIERFPHIRGRIQRAFNLAHHLYKVMEEEGIEL